MTVSEPKSLSTSHQIILGDARSLGGVDNASVDLVVTSPPYPMIEMWDGVFAAMDPAIGKAVASADGDAAFEAMHRELDKAWAESFRVLQPGGFACINIGDATRTLGGVFRLWSNHSRILAAMAHLGFHTLPDILWRKQTNAPNKFIGSGMLPAGAYVTYEHEYILIFRRGSNRLFKSDAQKEHRRRSAFFWEERNVWFSDIWTDLKGTGQDLGDPETRSRSGAFPFELPYRLICMLSAIGDTVLDPFLGTGTTMAAAIASGRCSIGVERDEGLLGTVRETARAAVAAGNDRIDRRLIEHRAFVEGREAAEKPLRHRNVHYRFPVMTAQETGLQIPRPVACRAVGELRFEADYDPEEAVTAEKREKLRARQAAAAADGLRQSTLFDE